MRSYVLDHDPAHGDIQAFFQRFQAALACRRLTLHGLTTDGSELYPQPISEVFGAIEHQVCRFHILAELDFIRNKDFATVSVAACGSEHGDCVIHKPLPWPSLRPRFGVPKDIFHNAGAFHAREGMLDMDSEACELPVGSLLSGCEFPSGGFFFCLAGPRLRRVRTLEIRCLCIRSAFGG